eukprot:266466_1
MNVIQDIFSSNKNNSSNIILTNESETNKTKKSLGSVFKGMKDTMKSQGVSSFGAAVKKGMKDVSDIRKDQKQDATRKAIEAKKVIALVVMKLMNMKMIININIIIKINKKK